MPTPVLIFALLVSSLPLSGCIEVPRFPAVPEEPWQTVDPADASGPKEPFERADEEPASLRMGAWNVRRLGAEEETDVALLARLIERHFDLLGLVEVMQTGAGGHAGLDRLMESLGPAWSCNVTASPRPNLRSPFAEFYAILFRKDTVAPCDDLRHLEFHPEGDGSDSGGPGLFLREPAFGCYRRSTSGMERGFDFLLGVYHARWGTGVSSEIADEVRHLDQVLERQASLHPAEKDILLLGDFNLGSTELQAVVKAHDATEGSGSTLNRSGERSDNLLDHLLVMNPDYTHELLGAAQVLDLRSEAGSGTAYVERISDHLPIRALFFGAGPDDDG